jgi:hypothetical protein
MLYPMFSLEEGGLERFLKDFNKLDTLPNAVVCCTEQETFYVRNTEVELFQNIIAMLKSYDIPLYIILTCNKGNQYDSIINSYKNIHVLHWETYWITMSFHQLKEYPSNVDKEFCFPFIAMNSFIRKYKCLLMDLLAERNLVNKGAVAWHNLNYKGRIIDYKYKHWVPEVKKLSGQFIDIEKLQELSGTLSEVYNLPIEYGQSFMSLIMESDIKNFMITEKTAVPLLTGQPFLAFASRGYHKKLKDLGFQLYDEIFDYSFDNKVSLESRGRGIVDNVEKISKLSQEELKQVNLILLPKLNFNKEHAEKIAKDISRPPTVFLNLVNSYTGNEYLNHIRDIYFTKSS